MLFIISNESASKYSDKSYFLKNIDIYLIDVNIDILLNHIKNTIANKI